METWNEDLGTLFDPHSPDLWTELKPGARGSRLCDTGIPALDDRD